MTEEHAEDGQGAEKHDEDIRSQSEEAVATHRTVIVDEGAASQQNDAHAQPAHVQLASQSHASKLDRKSVV